MKRHFQYLVLIGLLVILVMTSSCSALKNFEFFAYDKGKYDWKNPSWQWTSDNTLLAGLDLSLTALDWSQTRYIAAHPDEFYEKNKILGKHPSDGRVNSYFPLYYAAKLGLSVVVPNPYRLFIQGGFVGADISYIYNNGRLGIGFTW